ATRATRTLQGEVESGRRAEAGDGRDVERERERFRDARELPLHRRHDTGDVQRWSVALVPRFEPDEDRTKVRLIRARDSAIAADRLVRVDAVRLGEDVLHLTENGARPLERRAGRQLHRDPEDPLVLVGHEAGAERAAEDAR